MCQVVCLPGNSASTSQTENRVYIIKISKKFIITKRVGGNTVGRSRWPRGLGRRSVAARLLGLRVRIPVAHRSKAIVCGSSPAGITGSNPSGDSV
jgi:hypothetical protein